MGQGLTQLLQLASGFILIRWLTKDAYATFTLVMAIQGTTQALVEMGISQSLTGLIGRKIYDFKAVGRYIAACRYYRDRLLLIGCTLLFGFFILIAPRYGWTEGLWIWLWLSVVLALVFQAWAAIYSPVFLLHQDLKTIYTIGVGSGAMRLAFIAGAHVFGILTAPLALMFGALQSCVGGWSARVMARSRIEEPDKMEDLTPEKKAILSQALPRVPSNIFYAFEGQITIFLIGIFGTTAGIAEIGALSRLAMLFLIFKKAGNILISPYFAKVDSQHVLPRTIFLIIGTFAFFVAVSGFTYAFPQPFLFILGDGYQHLGYEVFLIISVSALRLVNMVVFSVCVARKYIFSWFAVVDVVPLLIVMVVGFTLIDLSSLTSVLYLSFAMALTKLMSKFFILAVGLRREIRA
jgi:O-antigen/teichoic acid export membrane protein